MGGRVQPNKLTNVYKPIRRRFDVGRILKLRLILGALLLGTLVYLGYNLYSLTHGFRETGSWSALWRQEWESGASIAAIAKSGILQLFVLILGWNMFFQAFYRLLGHDLLISWASCIFAGQHHAGFQDYPL